MSKRKTNASNIELGIMDSYEIEDESVIETVEDIPEEETASITRGKIVFVGLNKISVVLDGYGYTLDANTSEDWVKVGAEVNVIHKGTPGRGDFTVIEMKNNG